MELRNRIFPYPIYSSIQEESDYSCKPFEVNLIEHKDLQNEILILDFSWKVFDSSLLKEIENGNIVFAVHIECPSTTYFALKQTQNSSLSIELPLSDINQVVQVVSMLLVNNSISAFTSPNLSKYYANTFYYFEEGNIIGFGDSFKIVINKDTDFLKKISNIFQINYNLDNKKFVEYQISAEDDKVLIFVPKTTYDYYESASQNPSLKSTLDSLFIVPVLQDLLHLIKNSESFNFDQIWVKAISNSYKKLYGEDINEENRKSINPLVLAQQIFNSPYINSFDYVLKVGQEKNYGEE